MSPSELAPSSFSPLQTLSVPMSALSFGVGQARHLRVDLERSLMQCQDSLDEALVELSRIDADFNRGLFDRGERDERQSLLNIDLLLEDVLMCEAEATVLHEVFFRAGSYAMDRVIAYHVRQSLARSGVLADGMGMRQDLLELSQAVRLYVTEGCDDDRDAAVRLAWQTLRRHICPKQTS